MSDSFQSAVDAGTVADPDARRVLRAMQQEYTTALARQQAEIDAILEVLLEKHVTSVGELRRHVARLQQQQAHGTRAGRVHDVLWGTAGPATVAAAAAAHPTAS